MGRTPCIPCNAGHHTDMAQYVLIRVSVLHTIVFDAYGLNETDFGDNGRTKYATYCEHSKADGGPYLTWVDPVPWNLETYQWESLNDE